MLKFLVVVACRQRVEKTHPVVVFQWKDFKENTMYDSMQYSMVIRVAVALLVIYSVLLVIKLVMMKIKEDYLL
jgi:hypothetical protein